MKVHHYSDKFGSIKVPIYACSKKDCMFHHRSEPTCALFVPHVSRGKCESYTPIQKEEKK